MPPASPSRISDLVSRRAGELLAAWLSQQRASAAARPDLVGDAELEDQSKRFVAVLEKGLRSGDIDDTSSAGWVDAREYLRDLSRSRAMQGFKPSETAAFVFSLRQPIFDLLWEALASDAQSLGDEMRRASLILDQLGLYTTEMYQQTREEIIARQQQELLELSTPVVRLWDRILALPLVGTLDSSRTQVVMESLLERIVETGSEVAIIDITGVPTVDTLVAQHLLKTVAATRLMGADCIISGIRPQIAQTIVHLGVDLGPVVTKATLADAFAVALKRTGTTIDKRASRD
ncbi:MAG: STAS domain-containing protein [Rudaea sp.]